MKAGTALSSNYMFNVNTVESSIANNAFETVVMFDSKGKEIYRKIGNDNEVIFDIPPNASIITHNHPIGGYANPMFSLEDLETAFASNAKEFRMVAKPYVHSISRSAKGWPSKEDIGYSMQVALEQAFAHFIKPGKSDSTIAYQAMKYVFGKNGIKYTRTKLHE